MTFAIAEECPFRTTDCFRDDLDLTQQVVLKGFTKVNEFPRFWGIRGACALSPMQWITRPCFRPSVKIEKTRPGIEARSGRTVRCT